jgi:2-polyprenyl-6-methoxyphenol hydroxylase-like FAD-dependent oxidoreductase
MKSFDVCVRGSGPVGQSLALALGHLGLRTALVSTAPADPAKPVESDVRTYALNQRSVALLKRFKVWEALRTAPVPAATAVLDMKVFGDAGGHLAFSAWSQHVGELAWIVDAAALERELANALRFAPNVTLTSTDVPATLLALCEGRDSREREALGVEVDRHDYGQRAVAARLASDRPHLGTAWQWFRAPDVLALLPFDLPPAAVGGEPAPRGGFGLVWSLPDARADALQACSDADFEQALDGATAGAAGRLRLASPRSSWPLRLATARRWHGVSAGRAWVLVGDAAHAVHPLAGQGLNLGFADVDTLADVLAERERREPWRPLSDAALGERYARRRRGPTWAMGHVTDGLQQLFSHDFGPLQELRNRGLSLVDHLPPLKRWLGRRALQG